MPRHTTIHSSLDLIRAGGDVRRFHLMPLLKEETVASHSFYVAWFAIQLSVAPSSTLILACLQHDLGESLVGDIPSTSKRAFDIKTGDLESKVITEAGMEDHSLRLFPNEARTLKLADCYAGWLKCVEERTLGNQHAKIAETATNYQKYILEFAPFDKHERTVYEYMIKAATQAGLETVHHEDY